MNKSKCNKFQSRESPNSPVCSVCGSELTTQFAKVQDSLTGEAFGIYRCVGCGVGHTLPQPKNLTHYYSDTYYGNRHGFTERYCIGRRIRLVRCATKGTEGRRLLDIGCGNGSFLRAIKDLGWDVAGTELNPHRESTKGLVVKEHIEEFSGSVPFDCITMWHTLEHMRSIGETLGQIGKILGPNGKLIIAVPNNKSFQAKLFKSKWLHLDVPRHLYHFDVRSLQACLAKHGFVVQDQKYQELEYDLLGWTQSALNSIFLQPNILFDLLGGKQARGGRAAQMANLWIGSLFVTLSLPAVIVERLLERSGTIITVTGKAGDITTDQDYHQTKVGNKLETTV